MARRQKRLASRSRVQMRLKSDQCSVPFSSLAHIRYWTTQTECTIDAQHHPYWLDNLAYYKCEVLLRKSSGTQAHQITQLAWWLQQLGYLRLGQAMPASLATCRNCLRQILTPAAVNSYRTILNHACSVTLQARSNTSDYAWPGHRVRNACCSPGGGAYALDGCSHAGTAAPDLAQGDFHRDASYSTPSGVGSIVRSC
jgi:hypothetical protein